MRRGTTITGTSGANPPTRTANPLIGLRQKTKRKRLLSKMSVANSGSAAMISVNCSEPAHGAYAGGVAMTAAAPCITNVRTLVANSRFAQCSHGIPPKSGWIGDLRGPHSPTFASRGRRSGEFATSVRPSMIRGEKRAGFGDEPASPGRPGTVARALAEPSRKPSVK